MKTWLKTCALLVIGLAAICIIGCGEGVEQEIDPVVFVSASPQIGSDILGDATITLTFDRTPVDVNVSARGATTKISKTVASGETVTIHGPFEIGQLNLIVTWRDGMTRLAYTVTETPTEEPSESVEEPSESVEEPSESVEEPSQPVDEPVATDGKPITVTDATFKAVVLNAEMPVVVEFGAVW